MDKDRLTITINKENTKVWISEDGFDAVYNITPSCPIGEIYRMYAEDKKAYFDKKNYKGEQYKQLKFDFSVEGGEAIV